MFATTRSLLALLVLSMTCVYAHVDMLEAHVEDELHARAMPGYGGTYAGMPICDKEYGHCLYIVDGYTPGQRSGPPIRCANTDANDNGYETCQFPASASTRAICSQDSNSYVDVTFDAQGSKFNAKGNVLAVFSSQRKGDLPGSQAGRSYVQGDDLYVTCKPSFPVPNEFAGVYPGKTYCDNNKAHCVFMTNAYTYGTRGGGAITCYATNTKGQGFPTCQYPMQSSTRIFCFNKPDSYVDVSFGEYHTSFYAVGSAVARFTRTSNAKQDEIELRGADVHVTCY